MNYIDTHSHVYLEQFEADIATVIESAINVNVSKIILPNIDTDSIESMLALCKQYPFQLYPMIGLHPTSVGQNYKWQLDIIEKEVEKNKYCAIGECGIDLYWDTTYKKEQISAFNRQIELSIEKDLPLCIHLRSSHSEVINSLKSYQTNNLKGVFHCFSGDYAQAVEILDMGFYLGIGGVITFKGNKLAEVVSKIGVSRIILETDSPFLAPMPFRGKRNEPAYIPLIANKIANILNISSNEVAKTTTNNALQLFNLQ